MKRLILTGFLAMLGLCLFSQNNKKSVNFSLGINVLFPSQKLFESADFGAGASIQGEYRCTHLVELTGSVGFIANRGKQFVYVNGNLYSSKNITVIQIPVLVGARFYVTDKVYASGQLGVNFFNQKLGSAFAFAPGVGIRASKKIDLTLSYFENVHLDNLYSNFYFRFAYRF